MVLCNILRATFIVTLAILSCLVCQLRLDAVDRTKGLEEMKATIEKVKNRDLPLESRRAAAKELLRFSPSGLGPRVGPSDEIHEKVVPMLLSIATNRKEDSEIRESIVRAIGDFEIRSDLAVEKLTPLLLDETEDSGVRSWVAMVLNDLGPPEDISAALLTAAASPNEMVRVNASRQLGILELPHDVLLKWAVGAAGDPTPQVRISAINVAGQTIKENNIETDTDTAVAIILEGTMDHDAAVRHSAVSILAALWRELPVIAEYARQLLRSSDYQVRLSSAVILLNHTASQEEARRVVMEGLQSKDGRIRAKALNALGYLEQEIGWAVEAINEGLKDQNELARIEAAFSLVRITADPGRSFPVLVAALDSEDELNRHLALSYVGFIVPQATEAERNLLLQAARDKDNPTRCALLEFLNVAGVPRRQVLDVLSEAVADEDAQLRVCALDALGRMGSAAESALPAVMEAQRHPIAEVREAAQRAEEKIRKNER